MKRYSIELTTLQWGLIGVDLGQVARKSDSTEALGNLIRMVMEHSGKPDEVDLPYNIKEIS